MSTCGDAAAADDVWLSVDKVLIAGEQKTDPSLARCRTAARKGGVVNTSASFYWEDGFLMRKWIPPHSEDLGWNAVIQLVVPAKFRGQVLAVGHDHDFAGHLGVNKTYHRILRHFFWPGLKSDVVKYCRSCHRCQIAGKPNQVIPPAPLRPIPVISEPFERIILDCVGPLPTTKSGHRYLLTIMCAATRYPEAVPLRSLKAKPVLRALIRFFSTFGLPKVVQTDQGSNFLSRLFKEVLSELSIKHVVSSAYHPESQGALERFHQTLKTMFRTYIDDTTEWDDGLPLLLFAVRETPQESLGFSPADLIFGHTIRGPLKLLREKWGSQGKENLRNILDFVSSFRERLHRACECARNALVKSQLKMK
uniref:Gypsy retrotransposon integrase-like protein 1 n=1 Tax=Denticeps clupeoides TaxID=299321 RepID=A0AAY4BUY6_9TELE